MTPPIVAKNITINYGKASGSNDRGLIVVTDYNETLRTIMRDSQFRWDSTTKVWHRPLRDLLTDQYVGTPSSLKAGVFHWLKELKKFVDAHAPGVWQVSMTQNARAQIEALKTAASAAMAAAKPRLTLQPLPGVTPYPFQEEGVHRWMEAGNRALWAWEPGAGKTVGTLLLLHNLPSINRVVIVAPEHMLADWLRALQSLLPSRPVFVYGKHPLEPNRWLATDNGVLLLGWASAERVAPKLGTASATFEFLVLDECQYAKNRKAERTKAVRAISRRAPALLALSATPILNRPDELFPVLRMIDPATYGDFMEYAKRYCDAKHNGFGWDTSGASNLDELHHRLIASNLMHRVTKKDALPFLPAKRRSVVTVPISNRADYDKLANEIEGSFFSVVRRDNVVNKMAALEKLGQLRQCAVTGKLDATVKWIADRVQAMPGRKMVVFAHHRAVVEELSSLLDKRLAGPTRSMAPRVAAVTGAASPIARDAIIQTWKQQADVPVLVLSLAIGSTGLTLTEADTLVMVETEWSPGSLLQAEDRIHRIGQVSPVSIYYLVAEDTIDVTILETLHAKLGVVGAVLDGSNSETASVLDDVLAKLRLPKSAEPIPVDAMGQANPVSVRVDPILTNARIGSGVIQPSALFGDGTNIVT